MKKTKIIIPALGLLLLSTAASVTGTVAWFSANTSVYANNMNVKVEAEYGLVIANAAGANATYNNQVEAADTAVKALKPASTADLLTWLYSVSTNPGQANTQQEYKTVTTASEYYVLHNFYIRSSAGTELTIGSLDIKKVTATPGVEQALSKALRVGITFEHDTSAYIYAPITGYSASYSVQKAAGAYSSAAADRTDVAPKAGTVVSNSSVTSLPANTAQGELVKVYIWFEGEDAACISNNLVASLTNIKVDIEFGYTAA